MHNSHGLDDKIHSSWTLNKRLESISGYNEDDVTDLPGQSGGTPDVAQEFMT